MNSSSQHPPAELLPSFVAGVQMDIRLGDPEFNLKTMQAALQLPEAASARLVVFPECAVSGYCYSTREEALSVAETIPGPSTDKLQIHCRETNQFLAFGMLEREGDSLFNACCVVGPEGLVGTYRKSHLPYLGVDRFVDAGRSGPSVWDLGFLRLGVHICYDASFPETTRHLMLESADLVILPTNWPTDARVFAEHLAPVRAMENHLYFLLVNRVGTEGGFEFLGCSQLVDPFGQTLARLEDRAGVLQSSVDPRLARQKHIVREPGEHEIDRVADRRPALYSRLLRD